MKKVRYMSIVIKYIWIMMENCIMNLNYLLNRMFWAIIFGYHCTVSDSLTKGLEMYEFSLDDYKYYQQTVHAYKARSSYTNAMKKSVYFNYKISRVKTPQCLLDVNFTNLDMQKYNKNILCNYIDDDGNLVESKIEKKSLELQSTHEITMQAKTILNVTKLLEVQKEELKLKNKYLKYFKSSYSVHISDENCIITNWIKVDNCLNLESQKMYLESYLYKGDYRCDNFRNNVFPVPEDFFKKYGKGEFNQKNFSFACVDNQPEFEKFIKQFSEATINSKNYIIEALSRVEDENELNKLINKNFYIAVYTSYRVDLENNYTFYNEPITVSYSDINNYKERLGKNESNS